MKIEVVIDPDVACNAPHMLPHVPPLGTGHCVMAESLVPSESMFSGTRIASHIHTEGPPTADEIGEVVLSVYRLVHSRLEEAKT